MANSRFRTLFPGLSDPHADLLERLYPGYRLRRVYGELKSRLDWWSYGPVWAGRPLTPEAWRREPVWAGEFAWLTGNAQAVLPEWHAELAASLRSGGGAVTRAAALRLAWRGLSECHQLGMRRLSAGATVRPSGPTVEVWKRETRFPRKGVIESLLSDIRGRMPQSVHAALLHGSVADGHVVDGFSDCDLALVLKPPPADADDGALLDLAEWLIGINRWLLAYNPAAHHGPAWFLEQDLACASPVQLPPTLLEHGLWVGPAQPVGYADDPFGRVAIFGMFERFFECQVLSCRDVRSAFDAIWWTANVNILPCLLVQLVESRSIWKADMFASMPECLPVEFHTLLGRLETVRQRVGNWVASRLPDPVWPVADSGVLPGACVAAYKQLLAMTARDVAEVGLDDDLIRAGRGLWEYVSGQALSHHAARVAGAGAAPSRLVAWPARTTEVPRPAAMADYRLVRAEFVAAAGREPAVKAVYEFGSVGCPGLSDLDMLVVLRRGYEGVPRALTTEGMGAEAAALMGHDPIFIGEDSVELIGGVFPLFDCRQLYGDPLPVPPSNTFPADVQAVVVTIKNVLKYPRDILWLCRQPAVRWTTLLAYLNSFKHVARCLEMIGLAAPDGVRECIAMNEGVRGRFLEDGCATLGDLAAAIPVMLRGSVEAICDVERYWRRRFPSLDRVLPPFRPELFAEETWAALEAADEQFPLEPPALRQVGALSSMLPDDRLPASAAFADFNGAVAPAGMLRRRFAGQETAAGRVVSGYIRHPRFYVDPWDPGAGSEMLARLDQLRSPRYERFMLALNCFALDHQLRVVTEWSSVWEYPWLWFNALRDVDWRGKVLADLGSGELSPMPWLIARQGARVELVEMRSDRVPRWEQLGAKLGVNVGQHVANSGRLPLPDASVDVVTSFSMIEHQPDKRRAIDEAVRILKPGGILAMSFDICQPEMGMTFPEWNGSAMTMQEFEEVVWRHPAFGKTQPPPWNVHDIEPFRRWHLGGAAHHNYVVGATVLIKR